MEIKKIGAYAAQATQRAQEQSARVSTEDKQVQGQEGSADADRVKWSKGYQEMAQVKKVMMERDDVRTERVDHLRSLIENDQYQVEPSKVAQKMVEELY